MKKRLSCFFTVCAVLLSASAGVCSGQFCDVARDIADKAVKVYPSNPENGLKLFIKAYNMCSTPKMAYNLGIAYYRYGNTIAAQEYLEQAVAKDSANPVWLNNLACAVLANRGDANNAVALAKKAVDLAPGQAENLDTLAQALFAAQERLKALQVIEEAVKKHSRVSRLKETRKDLVKQYGAWCLGLIKQGKETQGLTGLEKGGFRPELAQVYCRALERLGHSREAFEKAEYYAGVFPGHEDFKTLYKELEARQIARFYALFKNSEENLAVSQAKAFSEAHPGSAAAKKAYDELLEALLGEPGTQIAKAQPVPPSLPMDSQKNTDLAGLLDSIGQSGPRPAENQGLTVDVDINIPKGRINNPNAIALLIGNQNYRTGLPQVKYAKRDVAVMAKYLEITLGYDKANIHTKDDFSSGDFRTWFGTRDNLKGKLYYQIRKGKSDLFVYYVGHGSPGPQGNTAFLVPVDAQADFIRNTGYSLDLFYAVMEAVPARHKTIVLDACFSGDSQGGALFKNISPALLKTASPVKEMAKATLFCAADKDQVAAWYPEKRHSLFSYFFLKGLQGAADRDKDKQIRVGELDAYLKSEVAYWAGRKSGRIQTPLVKGEDDFVLVQIK